MQFFGLVRNHVFWLLLVTLLTLFVQRSYYDHRQMLNPLTVQSNDTPEHLNPSDNLIEKGIYSYDGTTAYAARMPGYAFPYVMVRWAFDQETSRLILIVLQILLYCAAIALSFSWLSERYGPTMAFSGLAKLVVFNYVTHVHFRLLPVSFAISLVLILLYLHHRLLRTEHFRFNLGVIFGALLTWLVFLRPFFLPIALLWPLVILWQRGKWSLKALAVFFVPFALVEGAWIGRNYAAFDAFIPLQTTFTNTDGIDHYSATATKQSVLHLRPFISGFGGDNVWYFPGSQMAWFIRADDAREVSQVFPAQVFNAGITKNELEGLKATIVESYKVYNPEAEEQIAVTADDLTNRLRANSWFDFYVVARIKSLSSMVAMNVSQDWPMPPFAQSSILGKAYRLISVALWAVVFAGGLLLGVPRLFKKRSFELVLILFGLTFIFVYLVQFLHYQYFVFAWMAAFFIWMDVISELPVISRIMKAFRLSSS